MATLAQAAAVCGPTAVVLVLQHAVMKRQLASERHDAQARLMEEREANERRLEEEKRRSLAALEAAITQQEAERQEEWVRNNRDYPVPDFLRPYHAGALDDPSDHQPRRRFVNIAVVGDPGAGKSSLIKAMMSFDHRFGEAPVEVPKVGIEGDGTLQPTPYALIESRGTITLWDLPGHGTLLFPLKSYLRTVGLKYYDLVLVVTGGRWSENNVHIVRALKAAGVNHFLVRTRMDQAVEDFECDRGLTCEETFRTVAQALEALNLDASMFLVTARARHWNIFGSVADLWSRVLLQVDEP